jgi:hypothetical protein
MVLEGTGTVTAIGRLVPASHSQHLVNSDARMHIPEGWGRPSSGRVQGNRMFTQARKWVRSERR